MKKFSIFLIAVVMFSSTSIGFSADKTVVIPLNRQILCNDMEETLRDFCLTSGSGWGIGVEYCFGFASAAVASLKSDGHCD